MSKPESYVDVEAGLKSKYETLFIESTRDLRLDRLNKIRLSRVARAKSGLQLLGYSEQAIIALAAAR